MKSMGFETPASTSALGQCRELHRYICRQPVLLKVDGLELAANELWIQLTRVATCPIEDTLRPTLIALERMRKLLEARHAKHPINAINTLRAHLMAIDAYIETVPLAPASASLPWVRADDLSKSGLLFRLLQRKPLAPSVIRPRQAVLINIPVQNSVVQIPTKVTVSVPKQKPKRATKRALSMIGFHPASSSASSNAMTA
jgi:hypothetical protein